MVTEGKTNADILDNQAVIDNPTEVVNAGGDETQLIPLLEGVENETLSELDEDSLKSILSTKNGASFDKSGNVIDTDGNIVASFEDYKTELNDGSDGSDGSVNLDDIESIDIDGTEYSINENGEAVDDTGKVIKTRDEVVALLEELNNEDEGGETPLVEDIAKLSGFTPVDKDGNPLVFEDTPDGMAKREVAIVNQFGAELARQELDTFFENNPDIVEMYNYKKIKGSLDGFKDRVDYNKITVEADDDNQQTQLIVNAEILKGNSKERAEQIAKYLIEDGKGKDEAILALKYLKETQASRDRDAIAAKEAKENEERAAIAAKHEEIAKTVKSGKLNGIVIPEYIKYKRSDGSIMNVTRDFIYQYMTKPVKDGKSLYDIDKEKSNTESEVLDAYLKITGNDYSSIIKGMERQSKVDKLKDIKNRSKLSNRIVVKKRTTSGTQGGASNEEIVG